jgi:hypothetical protein
MVGLVGGVSPAGCGASLKRPSQLNGCEEEQGTWQSGFDRSETRVEPGVNPCAQSLRDEVGDAAANVLVMLQPQGTASNVVRKEHVLKNDKETRPWAARVKRAELNVKQWRTVSDAADLLAH